MVDTSCLNPWSGIVAEIRKGRYVELERFGKALRSGHPIPDEARLYLAGLIDGTIKRPQGNPHQRGVLQSVFGSDAWQKAVAANRVDDIIEEARSKGVRMQVRDALDQAAQETGLTADEINDFRRRGRYRRIGVLKFDLK